MHNYIISMTRIKYLLLVLLISVSISSGKHCKYKKCRAPDNPRRYDKHTMCLYPEKSFGTNCNVVKSKYLDSGERTAILRNHNKLRARVADGQETRGLHGRQPAGVIRPLKWSKQLASIAQRWANQCTYDHDKCRDVGRIRIGQNIGLLCSSRWSELKFYKIFMDWYDEVENCSDEVLSKFKQQRKPSSAHYTQIIWAKTTHVGCGGVRYVNNNGVRCAELVCNYGPRGNRENEAVYKILGTHYATSRSSKDVRESQRDPVNWPHN